MSLEPRHLSVCYSTTTHGSSGYKMAAKGVSIIPIQLPRRKEQRRALPLILMMFQEVGDGISLTRAFLPAKQQ